MQHDSEREMVAAPARGAATTVRSNPTIREVARVAGVSYGTVSRYLNGHRWVGEQSAAAIKNAIEATGYRPNRHARSLATGRASTVVFLLPEAQDRLFGDPNNPVLLREMSAALLERGVSLVLMTAGTPAERGAVIDFLRGGPIDGVLLVSPRSDDPMLALLVEAGVRTVCCGRPAGWESQVSSVSADDLDAGYRATAHLVAGGRRRIGMIAGPQDFGGAVDRVRGYQAALREAGIEHDPTLVVEGDWSNQGGRTAMAELLDRAPDIDAVFASNDTMAGGALTALRAAGRTVPDDVAVVGFDDTGVATTLEPPLTTLRQPFAEISREMVRLLLDRDPDEVATKTVPAQLVMRGSTPVTRGD